MLNKSLLNLEIHSERNCVRNIVKMIYSTFGGSTELIGWGTGEKMQTNLNKGLSLTWPSAHHSYYYLYNYL